MDNNLVLENGQKKKLGISWKMQPLTGGIKEPKDRKYGATIQFRGSSGALGDATVSIYKELSRLVSEGIKNGTIKVKKDKSLFRSVLQTELESGEALDDPIIRFKLPFDDNGRPLFKIVRIEEVNGEPKSVNVRCTEEDVHTIIKSRMLTSGYVSMDTVCFSGFGISVPAKVQLLVIKPAENDAPDPESFMSREEMIAMIGEADDKPENKNEDEDEEGDEKNVIDEVLDKDAPATDAQLQALRDLALDDNTTE